MNPRASLGDEASDRGFLIFGFEELDEGLAGAQSYDTRAIGVIEWDLLQTEHIAEERQGLRKGLHGDPNVRNTRPAWG